MSKNQISKPEITIIVPCYNVENSVQRCLKSVADQTYTNYEVIVVDDGSTDQTPLKIKSFIRHRQRFQYFRKKNGGLSSARNYGIEKARGKYICFVDSDDYLDQNYLKSLIESIKNNHSDLAICAFNRVYPQKTKFNPVKNTFSELIKYTAAWNKLYKTTLFTKNNIRFPEGMWYEDLGTLPKLLMLNPKISIINQPLYNYIINGSSITHTYDNRIYQIYNIVEDLEDFASKLQLRQHFQTELEFIHIYHILTGTIYRISFKDDFSPNTIKDIQSYVESKYPNWPKNDYIKTLPIHFKIFLFLLKKQQFQLVYLITKLFNRIVIL